MNRLLHITALLVSWPILCLAAPNVFYVTPGPSKSNDTFGSITQALQAACDAKSKTKEDAVIYVRQGMHQLEAAIEFTPADSGVTVCAFTNERPVISGGRAISGWKLVEGSTGVWEAPLPKVGGTNRMFRSLFVNGSRRTRARTPNEGFFRIEGPSSQDKPMKVRFRKGDIRKSWAEAGNVELVALLAWSDIRMYIRQVDEEGQVATLSRDPRPSNREDNGRYYIENAPDSLDAPGEWQVRDSTVRYIPLPDEDMTKVQAIAGLLDDLVIFRGEGTNPVRNVVLRGLTFSHTDWSMETNGYADTQAAIAVRGDIRAEWATHCKIEDNTFSHLAGYALELGRGCQNWEVTRNEIHDVGAGGIRLGETTKPTESADGNSGHRIVDNRIHHGGVIYPPAVGVLILQSGTNRVAHNEIHHFYYTAVSVGWNWGYQETPCRENIVEFNHLYDIGQSMLSDMGAVYTLGIQRGTVVRNNLIHDVHAFTYGGWGLYPDEGSSHILFENNVVYRCKSAGFHQHYGRENIVRNNVFAFGKENQLMRTREESHISFIFTNNIVYFDSGNLLGSAWKNGQFLMDRNIYFDKRAGEDTSKYSLGGNTWAQWQSRGQDTNSLIANPLFRDVDKHDFQLQSGSPAFKVGFKQIDLSAVGPRKKK